MVGRGIGSGVTGAELVEAAEVPAELVAVTVNVKAALVGPRTGSRSAWAADCWPFEPPPHRRAPSTVETDRRRALEPATGSAGAAAVDAEAAGGPHTIVIATLNTAAVQVIHRFIWPPSAAYRHQLGTHARRP